MLNKEECQKACLYLLKHCYETDAPALENGEEGKTYTFTPSGFKESEIFKQLIEEHFYPQPLKFENLKKDMWIWDDKYKECRKIYVHTCAVILGVFANKLIGGSVIGILNILFGTEMFLYATFELFARNFDDKKRDGFFYSGLAMVSLIAMNVINAFYR